MTSIIVVAAGSGRRVGADGNKLLLPVGGRPLLAYTLLAVSKAQCCDEIVIAVHAGEEDIIQNIVNDLLLTVPVTLVTGRKTRQESVQAALEAVDPAAEFILIHDGARPYVAPDDIDAVAAALCSANGALLVKSVQDTVKYKNSQTRRITTIPRDDIYLALTPQGFRRETLYQMYRQEQSVLQKATDDASLLELMGEDPVLVVAQSPNKKITTWKDYLAFQEFVAQSGIVRTGSGYDIHRTKPGDAVTLCGVTIPAPFALEGHSDADCALHALTDALLAAAGKPDIGTYFPDTDEQYRGVRSGILLRRVVQELLVDGFLLQNATITIIAQAPKLQKYISDCIATLAQLLCLPDARIAVHATTHEKLGPIGEKRGIAAMASATIIERMNNK